VASAYAKPQIIYNAGLTGYPFGAVQYTSGLPLTYSTGFNQVVHSSQIVAAPAAVTYAAPAIVAPAFTKTQYHAQDELGQASYGYAHPGQAHAAVRDAAGGVRGSYAYIGADGSSLLHNMRSNSNERSVQIVTHSMQLIPFSFINRKGSPS
jgi:hypothetical protein